MNTVSPALLGFLRGIGVVAITAVLIYLSDAAHLHGIVPDAIASFIAAAALAIETSITHRSGSVLGSGIAVR